MPKQPKQQAESPLLDLLEEMTALSLDKKWLDERTVILTRIAALAASGASPHSYALNIGAAQDLKIKPEDIRGVLGAIAPIVGTARIVAAVGNIAKSKALALSEFTELEAGDLDLEREARRSR
jgi:alkylhydroperoxidase/carboxymuconolactone decarboxylase family protein YurZ